MIIRMAIRDDFYRWIGYGVCNKCLGRAYRQLTKGTKMKKIIIATILAVTSINAVADTRMDLMTAENALRDSTERFMLVEGKVKDTYLASYQFVKDLKRVTTPIIVNTLNNTSMTCEEIGAKFTSLNNQKTEGKIPATNKLLAHAAKDLSDKIGDWAMYQCFDLKG